MVGSGHRRERPALQEEGLEAGVGLELPPLLRRPGPGGRVDGRVWGALIPSRTLGDFPWKDKGPGLIATPEEVELEVRLLGGRA